MNPLQLLEQKISSLVEKTKEFKDKNAQLSKELEALTKQNKDLKAENAKFAEHNAQLQANLNDMKKKALEGNGQIDELNQEKALTKMAVDDLLERLKSIDSLVEKQ